jgi:hypothetical protein
VTVVWEALVCTASDGPSTTPFGTLAALFFVLCMEQLVAA